MIVHWTGLARTHVRQINAYLTEHSPNLLESQLALIVAAVNGLRHFPGKGRPGRVDGTRELIVLGTPFIVAYTEQRSRVAVVAVIHSSRRWPKSFEIEQEG